MCGIIKKSDTKINIRTIERFDWLRALSKVNVYEKGFPFTHLLLKPFHATGLFLCPLKTSEHLWFSDVFRGYRKRPVA